MMKRMASSLWRRTVRQLGKWRVLSPRLTSVCLYRIAVGRMPDLDNPRDMNEKILALSFRTDTSRWSVLADKYGVRKELEGMGLGDMLIPLYQVADSADGIDFDALPDSFVLKTTDGFSRTLVVRDKAACDRGEIRRTLRRWMSERSVGDEPHYGRIKRRIIAERLLPSPEGYGPTDYKIFCCDGEPLYCLVCSNRCMDTFRSEFKIYSLPDWRDLHGISKGWEGGQCTAPVHLEEMMARARVIAKEFPLVRVDFYEEEGRVWFGEVTFTSAAGREVKLTQEMLSEIGSRVTMPVMK